MWKIGCPTAQFAVLPPQTRSTAYRRVRFRGGGISFPTKCERFHELSKRWVGTDGAHLCVTCRRSTIAREVNEKKGDRRSVCMQDCRVREGALRKEECDGGVWG